MQAMDTCSMEVVAATLCSLGQLPLLAALLTTLLIATIVALAVAVVTGGKSLQKTRKRVLPSLNNPVEESSRDKGELVLPISTTSGHAVQKDISYFSREPAKYSTSITTTTPVQRVSMDKGELVVS